MSYAIVSRFLGLLLVVAAGLKAHGVAADPVARSGVFSAPAVQFLIIACEIGLGVWLLYGTQPIGSWLIALTTFAGFAVVTFYQGWIEQASCGCAGRLLTINPWVAFLFDLTIFAVLLRFRPDLQPFWDNRRQVARIAAGVGGAYVIVLGCAAAIAHFQYGSIGAALAALRNERLSISPDVVDMGEGVPGETREADLEVANWTEHPVRLIGGTSDCSCTVLGDLPVTIPPGEARSIKITIRSTGRFTRRAELQVDDEGFDRVGFQLTGRIKSPPRQPLRVQRDGR